MMKYIKAGCCDPFNDKALRASRGAAFKLAVSAGDWQALDTILLQHNMMPLAAQPPLMKGTSSGKMRPDNCHFQSILGSNHRNAGEREVRVIETSRDSAAAEWLADVHTARIALVLGSEGRGLSAASQERCRAVAIPMTGPMESLSVSQAGAILLFALSKSMPSVLSDLTRSLRDGTA